VFGSLFAVATDALVIGSGVAPRWLRWALILAGIVFFLQGFGLGGVIASFGLVLDLIGFALVLIFVLVSSVILLTRERRAPLIACGIELDNLVQASSATR
jgi:heme A synthase